MYCIIVYENADYHDVETVLAPFGTVEEANNYAESHDVWYYVVENFTKV